MSKISPYAVLAMYRKYMRTKSVGDLQKAAHWAFSSGSNKVDYHPHDCVGLDDEDWDRMHRYDGYLSEDDSNEPY